MKQFLRLFLLFALYTQASDAETFQVEFRYGYMCVSHKVEKNERLSTIAENYFVKTNSIATVNKLDSNAVLRANQSILIPLLETNYFKMPGITAGKDFLPVMYTVGVDDNLNSICRKFQIPQSSFVKWNALGVDDHIKGNDQVIVGWLKHAKNKKTVSPSVAKLPPIRPVEKVKPVTTPQKQNPIKPLTQSNPTTAKNSSNVATKPIAEKPAKQSAYLGAKDATAEPSKIYKEIEREEGNKVSRFFSRIKNKLKSSGDDRSSASDVKKEALANENEVNVVEKPKQKKSLKQVWYNLVNGKDKKEEEVPVAKVNKTVAPAHNNKVLKTNTQPKTSNNTSEKKVIVKKTNAAKNDAIAENKKTAMPYKAKTSSKIDVIKKEEKLYEPIRKNAETKSVVKKEEKLDEPVKKKTETKSVVKKEEKIEEPVKKKAETKSIVKKEEKVIAPVKKEEQTIKAIKEEENIVKEKTETNEIVSSEVKSLSLSHVKLGKCAYFFSGPTSGKFYVFTNVAPKGEIVKVINTLNNKSVFAEVIGGLPKADENKGVLLKISDNAKLPLRQKSGIFPIKVNY